MITSPKELEKQSSQKDEEFRSTNSVGTTQHPIARRSSVFSHELTVVFSIGQSTVVYSYTPQLLEREREIAAFNEEIEKGFRAPVVSTDGHAEHSGELFQKAVKAWAASAHKTYP